LRFERTKRLSVQTKPNATGISRPRNKTKHHRILSLLRAQDGAAAATIVKVTGWQPHVNRRRVPTLIGAQIPELLLRGRATDSPS
jgi:Protein of unknown function (DUF3489)